MRESWIIVTRKYDVGGQMLAFFDKNADSIFRKRNAAGIFV